MKRIIALVGVISGALGIVLAAAGPALASTGPRAFSPEQAGYSATGNRFDFVDTTVKLPDASQFASNVAGFGLSVQLWTKTRVVVLGVSNSTTPGDYSAAVAVYSRTTHHLICSTASSTQSCPSVPSGWTSGKISFPVGDTVSLSIQYDRSSGFDFFDVFDHNVGIILDYAGYAPGTGKIYDQARAGAEFSAVSPWDGSFSFTAPATETQLANFTNSLLITYSGHVSGFSSSRFVHHQIFMTSTGTSTGTVEARPHNLHSFGQSFGVFLEP